MPANNILVTGGAGYIGSHTCKVLAESGYRPVVYDNLVAGHEWAVKWGPLEIGDIADRDRLDEVIEKYQPSAVLHFAAFAYVGESVENPGKYYRNNVADTLTLLETMSDHDIDKLVFSSTCATYGEPLQVPIAEDHSQNPINPYGMSKLMVEKMIKDCGSAYGLRSITLRYFNAAGADPDGDIGEDHNPETHLIPILLDVAAGKRLHVTVFGEDYPTYDGTCIRDYIHVTDLGQAHVVALQELERLETLRVTCSPARAYNLGNGQGFSVKEVIEAVGEVTGKTIPVQIGERRPGDPPILVGDATRICQELNWQPQYKDLKAIIETAWQWTRKRERLNL
ncbi:UDP-glucose 4-epimerase GalE [Deltaproteobacteria bacterium IMCC39524]|nr:UDP-glucose 4-epimerase GalE [Deltaproteobacteria bacterium IMCC39524]